MANTDFIEPQDPLIGKTIGDEFTVVQRIGSGGMGAVYRAVQQMTERSVALKVLHGHLHDTMFLKRFTQEARIISRLSHPNIVTIFKYGQSDDGSLYIAMEFVDGANLADLIVPEWRFEVARALPLMIQMADALAYAHEKQIIHRDIKPENMVLTTRSRSEMVKVLDFGVAKIVGDGFVRTKTGALCGSPPYMSPEQWKQVREIDGRSDIYSLGCVFYRMLTGYLPFDADTTVGFMKAHLNRRARPPGEFSDELARRQNLSDIIMRCIARDRDDRFSDAYALLEELKEVQSELSAKVREVRSRSPEGSPSPRLLPSFLDPTPLTGDEAQEEALKLRAPELSPPPAPPSAIRSPAPAEESERPRGSASARTLSLDDSSAPTSSIDARSRSADNLPLRSSGTNIPLPPRINTKPPGPKRASSDGLIGSPAPVLAETIHGASGPSSPLPQGQDRQPSSRGRESNIHYLLIAAGSMLLLFLLISGLYFWRTGPSLEEVRRPIPSHRHPLDDRARQQRSITHER